MDKLRILIALFFLFTGPPILWTNPVLHPGLHDVLESAMEGDFIPVNLRLAKQIDGDLLYRKSRNLKAASERRFYVVNALKAFSAQHQEDLLTFLRAAEERGELRRLRPFWIGNVVSCEVTPTLLRQLMQRDDMAHIGYNKRRPILESAAEGVGEANADLYSPSSWEATWSVSLVGADQVWDMGYSGEGVVVAVLDTGVNYDHIDLAGNMWEHPDYPYHGYNFADNDYDTKDQQGHGTHCAGIVAGTGAAGTATGIAPSATIMSVQVLDSGGYGDEADVWAGLQFAIEYGAHILSVSLGWHHSWDPDKAMWRMIMDNALSTGIIASVASGNEGNWEQAPNEVRTPGNVPPPWLHPDQLIEGGLSAVVCVGATNNEDQLASLSSKGPVTWQEVDPYNDYPFDPGMGLIRPDLVAPGVDVISLHHTNNQGYRTMTGTSMATPAVAGLMALMLSKNPNLLPEDISHILETTAVPLGEGKNNSFGSGRINAVEAILATPYVAVRYADHLLDDSQGNSDGLMNPGELIMVNLWLENPSGDVVENAVAHLSVDSPYLTMVDSVAVLGDFQPLEIRSFEQLFAFQVAGNIPGHHEVKFTITAFSSEDPETIWVSGFSEIAHAPYLEFLHLSVDDTTHGNADSILDPGEMAYLQVEVLNTGQLPAPSGTLTLAPTDNWLFLLEQEDQVVPALEPLETATLSFLVAAFDNTPPETIAGLELSAQLSPFSFSKTMGLGIGQVPYYSEGMIPSTYKTLITNSSSALEPGELAVHIPQGATITGVDLFYAISSHGGAQMRNQRSFLRCVSPGGQTESQVSMGAGTEAGTIQYHRNGLDIANGVTGGGAIDFELHVFRNWGGTGSNTDFVYVPDSTWKVVVHFEMPVREVQFLVQNQVGQWVEDALIEVGILSGTTDSAGTLTLELPEGAYFFNATAPRHWALWAHNFFVDTESTQVAINMIRFFQATFNILDDHGNPVTEAFIFLNEESHPPGQHSFDGLTEGVHHYTVYADSFTPQSGSFEIINEDVELHILLEPIDTSLPDKGNQRINIYPNPARNFIFVEADEKIREIQLLDMSGQVIYVSKFPGLSHRVPLDAIKPGSYLILVYTQQGVSERLQIIY